MACGELVGPVAFAVEATGQGETGPFRRSAMADFEVYVPRGRFRGTFTSALQ